MAASDNTSPSPDLISEPQTNTEYQVQRVLLADDYPVDDLMDDLKGRKEGFYGFHIWGPCPNCGHPTNNLVPAKYLADDDWTVFRSAAAEDAFRTEANLQTDLLPVRENNRVKKRAGAKRNVVVFRCACNHNHSPDSGKFGCGSEWLLQVDYLPRKPQVGVVIEVVGDEEAARYWQASDDVASSIVSSASTAQTMAKTWTTVLGGIVGLLAAAGIVTGRDTIQSLPGWTQLILGIFAGAAIIAQGLMIYWGNVASTGFPRIRNSLRPRQLRDADLQPLINADASARRLHWSFWAAVSSAGAAIIAVSLFLFVPAMPPSGEAELTYDINHISHTTACGILITDESAGTDTFTPAGGSGSTYKISDITAVDKC
jgi:rRNA maturation protein Nop10